jgi:hypothetical protein|tara:strand:+ start:3616 stop:4125 length:510 start_codon:yes stop_codon:yes gene_type:complete
MKKLLIPVIIGAVIIAGYYIFKDEDYISPSSPEKVESIKELISGVWFHNDTTCIGKFNSDSAEEYNFGYDLMPLAINPIRFDRHDVGVTSAKDKGEVVAKIKAWFDTCKAFDVPEQLPVLIEHNDLMKTTEFYYYQKEDLIVFQENDKILALSRLEYLTALPRYISANL